MLKLFKKAFWIICEDITACPNVVGIQAAIAKYCEANECSYDFVGDNKVVIEGVEHEVHCARSEFCRGRYVIKCREK